MCSAVNDALNDVVAAYQEHVDDDVVENDDDVLFNYDDDDNDVQA